MVGCRSSAVASAVPGVDAADEICSTPGVDGVMLGPHEPHEALFRGIPWSTDAVYRETVDKAHTLGLMVHKGELHYDVDSPEDLVHLKKELAANPEAALHTAEFLRSL